MNALYKGIAVAVLHVLLVLSLGGKLLYDRATCPRVWVRTGSVDPDLPIRGRYLTLSLEARVAAFTPGPTVNSREQKYDPGYVELAVENGELVAHRTERSTGITVTSWRQTAGQKERSFLWPPVLFFLPEHAETPRRGDGELWVEVTLPRKGPPRPIQLALKRGSQWTPLTYR